MRVICDDEEYNLIWDHIFNEFCFKPSYADWKDQPWISVPQPSKSYKIAPACWDEKMEVSVNSMFEQISSGSVYALDYQHDCFEFEPAEHIPYDYSYYDEQRGVNIYFPSYYPNGDYHFFIDKGWSFGLFGHPWKQEIVVWGKELIEMFDKLVNM